MGAWGYGPMENDEALEWMANNVEAPLVTTIRNALQELLDAQESDDIKKLEAGAAIALFIGLLTYSEKGAFEFPNISYLASSEKLWDTGMKVIEKLLEDERWLSNWTEPDLKKKSLNELLMALQNSKKKNIKAEIGDVIELNTSKGMVYLHCIHEHPDYGLLFRVLPGFYRSRPDRLIDLSEKQELFFVFLDLDDAFTNYGASVVGHLSIPEHCKSFPTFKIGAKDIPTGKTRWWLWDGKHEWRVDQLDEDQRKLSVGGVWSTSLLVKRLIQGWTPSDEV